MRQSTWNSSISVNYQGLLGGEGRTWFFIWSCNLSHKSGCCRTDCRQNKGSSCWVEQTPKATGMATKTPLPSITLEYEVAMIAGDFTYILLTKEIGSSARGDINLTHPSPLPACCDSTLLQRSIWKIQRTVWLRRDWWESSDGSPAWAHKALFVRDQRETTIILLKSMHKEIKAEASFSLEKWLSSTAALKDRCIYTLSDLSTGL